MNYHEIELHFQYSETVKRLEEELKVTGNKKAFDDQIQAAMADRNNRLWYIRQNEKLTSMVKELIKKRR